MRDVSRTNSNTTSIFIILEILYTFLSALPILSHLLEMYEIQSLIIHYPISA